MTRYAVDAAVALRIVSEPLAVASGHRLVGPAILRSHALAALYRDVRAGRMAEAEGRRLLEELAGLKIRLLGDRVSRATTWRIAAQNDWPDTALAEYLAAASLQADALLTDDPALAAASAGIVRVADIDELHTPDAVRG